MKELTIEEKAKAYDEAIERAKKINNEQQAQPFNIMTRVFPELKESEDERIRKDIIEAVELHKDFTQVRKEHIYAWLEKQGELVNSLSKGLDNAHERIDGLIQKNNSLIEQLEKQGEQKSDTDFSDLKTWKYIVDAVWTEKEGIGQYLDSPFTEEVAKKLQKRFGNIEQKPADKVESKFKDE